MNIEAQIIELISRFVKLSPEEAEEALKVIPYGQFEKGTHLIKEGQVSSKCYFVLKGLVRQYELHDGEEKTTYFYTEEESFAPFEAPGGQHPSKVNWVCEEDCILIIGYLDQIEDNLEQNPKLATMTRLFMEEDIRKYQNWMNTFITLTPEERYVKLREKRPDLLNRVPQYQLASFLGIKPETLSRIRKRLALSK